MACYELSKTRVVDHEEPLEAMVKHGISIDGEGAVDGGETRILLQIFPKAVIGPIFSDFIQRKGDDGFGEGKVRALFESIEQDQIDRGVLVAKQPSGFWQFQRNHPARFLIAHFITVDRSDLSAINAVADFNLFIAAIRLPDQRVAA